MKLLGVLFLIGIAIHVNAQTDGWLSFNSEACSVQYPKSWELSETGEGLFKLTPKKNKSGTAEIVYARIVNVDSLNIGELTDKTFNAQNISEILGGTYRNVKLLENTLAMGSGRISRRYSFTALLEKEPVALIMYVFVGEEWLHVFCFTANAHNLKEHVEVIQDIYGTFQTTSKK